MTPDDLNGLLDRIEQGLTTNRDALTVIGLIFKLVGGELELTDEHYDVLHRRYNGLLAFMVRHKDREAVK